MSITELLLPEYDNEITVTRNVLERVPDDGDKGNWKPQEKAFPLAHLAQLVSMMPSWVPMVTEKPELDIAPVNGPRGGYSIQKTAKLLADLDNNAKMGREAIAKMTDEKWAEDWHLKAAGQLVSTQSRYLSLRGLILNHLVHHRAQLGLYLRILGEKVPEMYGPTADTKKS